MGRYFPGEPDQIILKKDLKVFIYTEDSFQNDPPECPKVELKVDKPY